MAIVATDLKLYHSGGGSNSNIANDISGDISSVELTDNTLNNLWDDVSGDESAAGDTEYRKIFFKNTHGSLTAQSTVLWIQTNTTSTDDTITIGKDPGGVNVAGSDCSNESSAPSPTVTFVTAVDKANGLTLGNMTAGQKFAIFVKRVVSASAAANDSNSYVLKAECDTAA